LLIGCSQQAPPKAPVPEAGKAASDAIGVLQKLVTEQNFKSMGFDSLDEVKSAQLGQPMSVSVIGLDKLKSASAGAEASSLLTPSPETIYPVTVGGAVRSSITIIHKPEGYAPASFGNAEIVKSLSRLRQSETGQNEFVLRIPAFNMYFLARRVENQVVAVPIVDDPRLKIKAGEQVPLTRLLEGLRVLANEYNGLPM
jgi:hypothetical protein